MGTEPLKTLAHIAGRRLWRERRRIAFVTVLAFLGGALLYAPVEATVAGLPFPIFAGLFYAVAVGISSAIVSLVLPRLRHLIEIFAVARLAVATAAFAIPSFGYQLIISPLLSASCIVALAVLIHRLGDSPAALRLRTPARGLALTLRLRPGAAPFDARAAEATLQAAFAGLPGGTSAGGRFRLVGAEERSLGNGREVTLRIDRPGLPVGLSLRGWIDDTLGRACDRLADGIPPQAQPAA